MALSYQALTHNIEESQSKKSYDARMNFKHVYVLAHDHLQCLKSEGKSQTEKSSLAMPYDVCVGYGLRIKKM